MKRLTDTRVTQLLAHMETLLAHPATSDEWYAQYDHGQGARIEFPSGEIMNPAIAGFVWAWGMQKRVESQRIETGDRFNANGLEGKVSIDTTLTTALLVYRALPKHRAQIRA